MKIPLLIPAKNEADYLGPCLERLDARLVDPIVVVNDSSDDTAMIAHQFGATVIETTCPGKLPALQLAMRKKGSIMLDGFLVLDADSRPLFPSRWPQAMSQKASTHDGPILVGGSVAWTGEKRSTIHNIVTSIRYEQRARRLSNPPIPEANLFIKPRFSSVLESLIEIEHFYPGEGRAIKETIDEHHGTYTRTLSPFSVVQTSNRYLSSRGEPRANWLERYAVRAPAGSVIPYHLFDK